MTYASVCSGIEATADGGDSMTALGRVLGRDGRKDNWREWKMRITRDKLRQWGACYGDRRISELVPESGLTPAEVAALEIPASDRLWVLLREAIVPARELRLLSCDWAEESCHTAGWDDARSLAAIAVARRYAVGEASESERKAAASAAWSAARSAGRAAAAARAAAWSAEKTASWSAAAWAADAASDAALSSAKAWSDALAAAREAQLADVVRVLRKSEGGTGMIGELSRNP